MEGPGELGKGIGGVYTLEGLQVESSLHWEERVASSRTLPGGGRVSHDSSCPP